jgi:acyl dehydratase
MAIERFPVEAGHILMFARSIGDPNPIYSDADYAAASEVGGIVAPPTFVQSSAQFDPDYFLRPHPDRPWHGSGREATGMRFPAPTPDPGGASGGGSGADRSGASEGGGAASGGAASGGAASGSAGRSGGVGLHAEQHYEYHRPLLAGDVLTATVRAGEGWEKQGRSGRLVFSETITEYRDLDGNLVVTARSVGVVTEGPKQEDA